MKRLLILFLISLSIFCNSDKVKNKEQEESIKQDAVMLEPHFAGPYNFYPDDKGTLERMIEKFMDVEVPAIEGDIRAIIVPHAGYIYSGQVAGYAYKAIQEYGGRDGKYKTVVLIGPSHIASFDGISITDNADYFKTPLGKIPFNKKLIEKLKNYDEKIRYFPESYYSYGRYEHNLEVQLPFLQMCLSDFDIVTLIVGSFSLQNIKILANALTDIIGDNKDILLVLSTDMSHYHSYDSAIELDMTAIKSIEKFDIDELISNLNNRKCELCGAGAVLSGLFYIQNIGCKGGKLLKYANSGDTAGTKDRVVGYFAYVFYEEKKKKGKLKGEKVMEELKLSKEEKQELIRISRETLTAYIKDGKIPEFEIKYPVLNEKCGAFTTLHTKDGELRGCIGHIEAVEPLYKTIIDTTISAAVRDPRFPPVTKKEVDSLKIEISVLSPLKKIKKPDEIVLGKHGVLIRKGWHSGVYLPQVATETGWDKETFMGSLCAHKAGLAPDAWKKGDVDIYIFTATVFSEEEFKK